jgi:hypothetical protein
LKNEHGWQKFQKNEQGYFEVKIDQTPCNISM